MLVEYLEAGIPAIFQMFVNNFVLVIILLSACFVAVFFLKLIRIILSIGEPSRGYPVREIE